MDGSILIPANKEGAKSFAVSRKSKRSGETNRIAFRRQSISRKQVSFHSFAIRGVGSNAIRAFVRAREIKGVGRFMRRDIHKLSGNAVVLDVFRRNEGARASNLPFSYLRSNDRTRIPIHIRSINDALTIWQGIVLDTGAENQVKVKAYIGEDNTYKRYEGRNALRSTMSELRSEFP